MITGTLELTHDECRRILRRLELETYSNIISTFRAQGSLNELKIKLLEELRCVFHISRDRHRAETRRAANDEQLCTVADKICGNNTSSEWNCQGRRSSPLLPRVYAPSTFITPQNTISVFRYDNSFLPNPPETQTQKCVTQSMVDMTSEQIVTKNPVIKKSKIGRDVIVRSSPIYVEDITELVPDQKNQSVYSLSTRTAPIRSKTRIQELYISHCTLGQKHVQCAEQISKSLIPLTCHTKSGKASLTENIQIPNSEDALHKFEGNTDHGCFPNEICGAKPIAKRHSLVDPQITSKRILANNLSKSKVFSRIPDLGVQQGATVFNAGKQIKNVKMTEKQEAENTSLGLTISNSFHLPENVTLGGPEVKLPDIGRKSEAFETTSLSSQSVTELEADSLKDLSVDCAVTVNATESNCFKGGFSRVIDPDIEVIYASQDRQGIFLESKIDETECKPISYEQKLDSCSQNIVCSAGDAKFSQNILLRKTPNRKKWKICASPCGKLFIQPNRVNQSTPTFKPLVTPRSFIPSLTLKPSSFQSASMKTSVNLDNSIINNVRDANDISTTIRGRCMTSNTSAISSEKTRRENVNGCCHGNKMLSIGASGHITTPPIDKYFNMSAQVKVSKHLSNSRGDGKQLTVTKKQSSKNDARVKSLVCLTKENTIQASFAESTFDGDEIVSYATNNVDWEVELDQEASKKEKIHYTDVHRLQNSFRV